MPKKGTGNKERISISLNKQLLENLDNFCKQNFNAERSAVIEEAIRKFLEREK